MLLHLTVLIFGLTGVIGKEINGDELIIVFYRLIFAVIGIFVYFKFSGFKINLSKESIKETWYVGVIVGLHWITFFGSINLSNVSVALLCFSSGTLFTSLLEPIYFKRKPSTYEIVLGIFIMFGIFAVCKEPGKPLLETKYLPGMLMSFFSAFLSSWFTVINGKLIQSGRRAKNVSFLELNFALIFVICAIASYFAIGKYEHISVLQFSSYELLCCAILGLLCTSFAYVASIDVMKELSPYTVVMSVNLEPIYSIVIATFLWPETEKMTPYFYIGACIIIGIIFLNGYIKMRMRKNSKAS